MFLLSYHQLAGLPICTKANNRPRARLSLAHLEGKTYKPDDADFRRIRHWAEDFSATLPGTDLREAVLDAATSLKDIGLGDAQRGTVRVADVRWGSANLAVVDCGRP